MQVIALYIKKPQPDFRFVMTSGRSKVYIPGISSDITWLVIVPINSVYTPREIRIILEDSEAKVLVTTDELSEKILYDDPDASSDGLLFKTIIKKIN